MTQKVRKRDRATLHWRGTELCYGAIAYNQKISQDCKVQNAGLLPFAWVQHSRSKTENEMTYTTEEKSTDQRFIHSGITWQQFKSIQAGFIESPGIQLFYYQGVLEILSTSSEHEIIKGNLGYLLENYMVERGLDFIGTGSFSLEKENEASAMADESYCFGKKKPIPDLAIEIVITSGGTNKLMRYQALGVKEVWFWQNSKISMYYLENESYTPIEQSQFISDLNIERLAQCAAIDSRVEAVREFRDRSRQT